MITDPTMVRIGEGAQLHHGRGQREAARHVFTEIWEEIGGEQGDPLHVCVLAHSMADVQDDVHQELLWDQRALAAADLLTDDRMAQAGVTLSVAGPDSAVDPQPGRGYPQARGCGPAPG